MFVKKKNRFLTFPKKNYFKSVKIYSFLFKFTVFLGLVDPSRNRLASIAYFAIVSSLFCMNGSLRQTVLMENCPTAKCPCGKLPYGKVSHGKTSHGKKCGDSFLLVCSVIINRIFLYRQKHLFS